MLFKTGWCRVVGANFVTLQEKFPAPHAARGAPRRKFYLHGEKFAGLLFVFRTS